MRTLAADGLVRIEPHRGAHVAQLTPDDVRWLYELRAALEFEGAHLALERNAGRLPEVHAALERLQAACSGDDPPWSAINEAHAELHGAIVAAACSPRIAAAHAALSGEMRLFLVAPAALDPSRWPPTMRRSYAASKPRADRAARSPAHRRRDARRRMSPLDPRLEKHKPALVYDPQEAYRAMSAASITDNRDNALKRRTAASSRARSRASRSRCSAYDVREGDRLDEANDYLDASAPVPGRSGLPRACLRPRAKPDGDRPWLQYWLWCYYNPKHLLGFGKHEGDWEVVQIGLAGDTPEVRPTPSTRRARRASGTSRSARATIPSSTSPRSRTRATSSPARTRTRSGSTTRTARCRRSSRGSRSSAPGTTGPAAGATRAASAAARRGRSPASPGRQTQKWDHPGRVAPAARATTPLRARARAAREAGKATYPKLLEIDARREDDRVLVDYRLDPRLQRRASRLLVTLHRPGDEDELLASSPEQLEGAAGTVDVPVPPGVEGDVVVRASAYNALRQRSDPLQTTT